MANVSFKQGTQASLDKLTGAKIQAGSFYLTNDTHRLYIGIAGDTSANNKVVPVNEGITVVTGTGDLPTITKENAAKYAGQFYFVTKGNILCVYNGQDWIQINNNTDHTYKTIRTVIDATDGISIKDVLQQFLNGSSTAEIAGTSTITLQGAGEKGENIEISYTKTSANGSDSPVITIDGTNLYHTISAAAGTSNKVDIKVESGDKVKTSKVTLAAGSHMTVSNAGNEITVAADDMTLDSERSKATAEAEGYKLTIVDHSNAKAELTINPEIKIGDSTAKFVNNVATLDTYNKAEIDSKMDAVNSMTYKGIWEQDTLPTMAGHKPAVGDTWKLKFDLKSSETGVDLSNHIGIAGDLIIARGKETGGVITSELVWDIIPSGNEDTYYTTVLQDHGFKLASSTDPDARGGLITYSLKTEDASSPAALDMTDEPDDTGHIKTVKIAHKLMATKYAEKSGDNSTTAKSKISENDLTDTGNKDTNHVVNEKDFTVVTGVQRDTAGHVVLNGVETTPFHFVDTNAVMNKVETSAAGTVSGSSSTVTATIKTSLKKSNNEISSASGNIVYSSTNESLKISASENNVKFDLQWGTF